MLYLLLLIIQILSSAAFENGVQNLTAVTSDVRCQNTETQALISDIASSLKKVNLVIISQSEILESCISDELITKFVAVTSIRFRDFEENTVKMIRNVHLKTNFPPFYMVIWLHQIPEDQVVKLIHMIKFQDPFAQIVVISDIHVDEKQFLMNHQLYDVHLFVPGIKRRRITVFSICRFCQDGNDKITVRNQWMPEKKFSFPLKFIPSFLGGFYGSKLRMGIGFGYHKIYGGKFRQYHMLLAEMLNVTWNFRGAKRPSMWYLDQAIQEVNAGITDIVGIEVTGALKEYKKIDFTASTRYLDGFIIVSVEPLKNRMDWSGLIKAFDAPTWICLFTCFVFCSIALYYFRKGTQHRRSPARSLWDATVILLWDSIRSPYPTFGVILMLSAYMHVIQLMINLYLGEYTGLIVNPNYARPPIKSLEQWRKTEMEWIECFPIARGMILNRFKSDLDIHNRAYKCPKLNLSMHPARQRQEMFNQTYNEMIRQPDRFVHFMSKEQFKLLVDQMQVNTKGRKFYFGKEVVFSMGHNNMFYSHKAYFKEAINRIITLIHAMGLREPIDPLFDFRSHLKARLKEAKAPLEKLIIEFKHFVLGLYIVAVGSILSLLALIGEVLYKRYGEQFPRLKWLIEDVIMAED